MTCRLTDRQAEALEFIALYISANGWPPTIREIGDEMGIVSTNGVNDHLVALERKGYITRAPNIARGLRILEMP